MILKSSDEFKKEITHKFQTAENSIIVNNEKIDDACTTLRY